MGLHQVGQNRETALRYRWGGNQVNDLAGQKNSTPVSAKWQSLNFPLKKRAQLLSVDWTVGRTRRCCDPDCQSNTCSTCLTTVNRCNSSNVDYIAERHPKDDTVIVYKAGISSLLFCALVESKPMLLKKTRYSD